jgi:hypothetical protein
VVFFCFFYILSQQLDNLEHSAHLYGQLTTVGLFTIIWSCTTFELFRLTIPNVLNDHNIVNSTKVVNGPNIVNSSNVVNGPNIVNGPNVVNSSR